MELNVCVNTLEKILFVIAVGVGRRGKCTVGLKICQVLGLIREMCSMEDEQPETTEEQFGELPFPRREALRRVQDVERAHRSCL